MSKKDTHVERPSIRESEIYEGGILSAIKVEDLMNNETAIRMVLNELNKKNAEINFKQANIDELRETVSELKIKPKLHIAGSILNAISIALSAVGSCLWSYNWVFAVLLLLLAVILLLIVSFFPMINKRNNSSFC